MQRKFPQPVLSRAPGEYTLCGGITLPTGGAITLPNYGTIVLGAGGITLPSDVRLGAAINVPAPAKVPDEAEIECVLPFSLAISVCLTRVASSNVNSLWFGVFMPFSTAAISPSFTCCNDAMILSEYLLQAAMVAFRAASLPQ